MSVTQNDLVKEFGVQPTESFDALAEINRRIDFLANYLVNSKQRAYVLGVSGGIDSSVALILARRATDLLTQKGYDSNSIAVRLPYGVQRDEDDAQLALTYIQPNKTITVDIKPATDALFAAVGGPVEGELTYQQDFVKGNIKARQRMVAQYAIAGANQGLVIGTDHAAEGLMGFFTKFGDGGADICPLAGLNKRQVRLIGKALGLPASLYEKPGTADLEDNQPGLLDETAYGVSQDAIDDFLEGKAVAEADVAKIIKQYNVTQHKRALPVVPQ